MKVALQFAMPSELHALPGLKDRQPTAVISGIPIYELAPDLLAACGGVGKVNAAMCAQILCRQAGVGKRAGELGADIQMDHLISGLGELGEEVDKLLISGGGGLGQSTIFPVTPVHSLRGKALSVKESLVSQLDGQGDSLDIETLQQL